MIIELKLNGTSFEPKFYTTLHKTYDINEKIIMPMRYCDLAMNSLIGITIYDMKRPIA